MNGPRDLFSAHFSLFGSFAFLLTHFLYIFSNFPFQVRAPAPPAPKILFFHIIYSGNSRKKWRTFNARQSCFIISAGRSFKKKIWVQLLATRVSPELFWNQTGSGEITWPARVGRRKIWNYYPNILRPLLPFFCIVSFPASVPEFPVFFILDHFLKSFHIVGPAHVAPAGHQ